jgi:nitric oxide reductase NorD protein
MIPGTRGSGFGSIQPKAYKEIGAPIRHLTRRFRGAEARIGLPVTRSDGKPDDCEHGYRSEYGMKGTRQVLFEAPSGVIQPFCVTIDEDGADYLPQIYAAANFIAINDIARLPPRLSDVQRGLTC